MNNTLTDQEQRFINRLTLAGNVLNRNLSTREKEMAVSLAQRKLIHSTDPERKLIYYSPINHETR